MPAQKRKQNTVIPVVCYLGQTSGSLAIELNRQAREDGGFNGVSFKSVPIKRLGPKFAWVNIPENLIEVAKTAPIVISAYQELVGDIENVLSNVPNKPEVLGALPMKRVAYP